MTQEEILLKARRVLKAEGEAILSAAEGLGEGFCQLVEVILSLRGRVVSTGVGKSGIIAMKIAGTLASTGTPSFFLNPTDAMHGDLGMVTPEDLLLALSHSGETMEILNVIFAAKSLGTTVAAMTGDPSSTLAKEAQVVVPIAVKGEACPLGLAPTTSTTVALAVGDALAMTLLELRGFTREDYARFHPGGTLGRRLSRRVKDFMRTGERVPVVKESDPLRVALDAMTLKETLGVTLVVNTEGMVTGILTDGDVRRLLRREGSRPDLLELPVKRFMTRNPKTIEADALASEALRVMEVKGITSLAILNPDGTPAGIVHLHDILGRSRFLV